MFAMLKQKEDAVRVGLYIVGAPTSASRLQRADDGLLKYLGKVSTPSDRCDPLFEPNGQILDRLERNLLRIVLLLRPYWRAIEVGTLEFSLLNVKTISYPLAKGGESDSAPPQW